MAKRKPAPSQAAIDGRWSRRYLRLRDQYRATCSKHGAPCHLCGQAIDYGAGTSDTNSFEVDHFYPVSTHPELFEDRANFRPSHKGCNASRGTEDVAPTIGRRSEDW